MTDSEIDAAAFFLGMTPEDFIEKYTAVMPDRSGLTLIEKPDGSCIFLEESEPPECRINPVKPQQCRRFPEHWNFPGWETECSGARR